MVKAKYQEKSHNFTTVFVKFLWFLDSNIVGQEHVVFQPSLQKFSCHLVKYRGRRVICISW